MSSDIEAVAAQLLQEAETFVSSWLPQGRRVGREWCCGSLAGEPGNSLKINLETGKWCDFATGEKGGDLVSLYAALNAIGQFEAAKQFANDVTPNPPAPIVRQIATQGKPPRHASLDASAFSHSKHGAPAAIYIYRDVDHAPLWVIARYESEGGKTFSPWTWREGKWTAKAADKPRALYGLHKLAELSKRVIVVEGEKARDALQNVLQFSPVVTWAGGAKATSSADWTPLKGRSVILWPDADQPGADAMRAVAEILIKLGCSLAVVDTDGLPDGWDAADAVANGYTGIALNEWLKPRLKSIDQIENAVTLQPRATAKAAQAITAATLNSYDLADRYHLIVNRAGIVQNTANVATLLAGRIAEGSHPPIIYDEFLQRVIIENREWGESDSLSLLIALQRDWHFPKVSDKTVEQVVNAVAFSNRRNCVKEWLQSLTWDKTSRVEKLITIGFAAPDSQYARDVGRCFMLGIVARVLQPGCQVDTLPVFEGAQGIQKTTALRILGGDWFAEIIEPVTSKDFYLALTGKMLIEIAEFSSFKRSEADAIRAAITRVTDRYRAPFGRRTEDHRRQCVFAATTNDASWNKDPTGARRFWPIKCGSQVNIEWLRTNREQLFAEAVSRFQRVPLDATAEARMAASAAWWDVDTDGAIAAQRERFEDDPLTQPVKAFVRERSEFRILDVIRFGLGIDDEARQFDLGLARRIEARLIHMGYVNFRRDGERIWSLPENLPAVRP